MSDFSPSREAAQAFTRMFGPNAEVAPLGCTGPSHFGFVNPCNINARDPGWHVSTQIGGLRQGQAITVRDFLPDR